MRELPKEYQSLASIESIAIDKYICRCINKLFFNLCTKFNKGLYTKDEVTIIQKYDKQYNCTIVHVQAL